MATLKILRGVPASGKSTYAAELVRQGWTRVNRDDLRFSMFGKGWGVPEDVVTAAEDAMIDASLLAGKNTVVDATNLRNKAVQVKLSIASEHGAQVEYRDFPISLEEALYRDAGRGEDGGRSVGEKVIRDFFKRYKVNQETGALKPPPELWPEFEMYESYMYLPPAYIIDTDGTVADAGGVRGWFDTSKYHLDNPIPSTVGIVQSLHANGFKVIGLSGRDAEFRDVTLAWWKQHGIPFDDFFMRPRGDLRNDAIIKYELFNAHVAPYYTVVGAIDDRPRVLRMWRKIGVPTLMVGDGREF